jgi:predicted SAM-dependent methyltransferase
MIKLNIGCGGRPLEGYINIDQDSLDDLKQRYPENEFSNDLVIKDYNIFSLPYSNSEVDEVRADGLLEHLSFKEEPLFLYEVIRILKPGGKFTFSVPDFEATCKAWLTANDDWQDFYDDSVDAIEKQHWFGTYSYGNENRWGYLMATFFGSQNGEGQYHKNGYSTGKIKKMLKKIGFEVESVESFRWKGDRDYMLNAIAIKK